MNVTHEYYDDISSTSDNADDDESDYLPSPKKTKKKTKKTRKRKITETDIIQQSSKENLENPTKKRKRGWSTEEEEKFTMGLEIYGRDWRKLSHYIGTNRNDAAMRSHAQIYFLKLLKSHKALPPKVLETGGGYTLSGKPLNKYSATVLKVFHTANDVPMDMGGVISDKEAAFKLKFKNKSKSKRKKKGKKENSLNTNEKIRRSKLRRHLYDDSSDDDYIPSTVVRNQNSNGMPRRSKRERKNVSKNLVESDPYSLRTDIEMYDLFQQQTEHSQPFQIHWCPNALLLADLHSHLCSEVEIMGLLAGTYDENTRFMSVQKCYPLKEEHQETQSVTADAVNYLNITQKIAASELQLLGWYHSHPHFENYPSNTDLMQHNLHKHGDERLHPYIGLIIASWSSVGVVSEYRWFNCIRESKNVFVPMELRTQEESVIKIKSQELMANMKMLIERYAEEKYIKYRINMGGKWIDRSFCDKLFDSLKLHMYNVNDEEKYLFIEELYESFLGKKEIWWITGSPSMIVKNSIRGKDEVVKD